MNLYPALQATMGSWKYYIAKMKMKEVANEVDFAYDVYEDRTLSQAIQRELDEGRVKREIVSFLARRKDRFFASLVVAAIGGTPKFYPVKITDDKEFEVFKDQNIDDAFGILTFSGEQNYYALDGQHRLKAIKTLLDASDPKTPPCPDGFADEQISVLIVIKRDEPKKEFLESYRRLFSSLNRYAKATDADTNIIMDEDDAFAILTRRLISEHSFFQWADGKQRKSARVKMKGKNLKEGEPYFTSLQTLYATNQILLSSESRRDVGWGTNDSLEKDLKTFKRFRPESEDYLESLYAELATCWDGILKAVPELNDSPEGNRDHEADGKGKTRDHLLFWPIGQELFANVARAVLDNALEGKAPTKDSVAKALSPLGKMTWDLHEAPWRYFLLANIEDTWKMRSEGRKEALELAERMLRWIVGRDKVSAEDRRAMKKEWLGFLIPAQTEDEGKKLWEQVEKLPDRVRGK